MKFKQRKTHFSVIPRGMKVDANDHPAGTGGTCRSKTAKVSLSLALVLVVTIRG